MTTTVSYKGNTIATVDNATKTLTTQGKYLEGNITLTDVSGSDEDTLVQALHNQTTSVSDDTLTSIRSYGLASITSLTSVTTCANVSAFLNTPVRGRSGLTAKIYVPEALIDSYKAASVWSTINGYGYVEWCAIEGSDYEL